MFLLRIKQLPSEVQFFFFCILKREHAVLNEPAAFLLMCHSGAAAGRNTFRQIRPKDFQGCQVPGSSPAGSGVRMGYPVSS